MGFLRKDSSPDLSPLLPSDAAHPAFDPSGRTTTTQPTPLPTPSLPLPPLPPQQPTPSDSFSLSRRFGAASRDSRASRRRPEKRRLSRNAVYENGHALRRLVSSRRAPRGLVTSRSHALCLALLLTLYGGGIALPVVISSSASSATPDWNERRDAGFDRRKIDEFYRRTAPVDAGFDDVVRVGRPGAFRSAPTKLSASMANSSAPVASRKLPQVIIIGVKKGGTRAFLEFLRFHPDVRAPGPEPHFFDKHYEEGLEWYRQLMPTTLPGQRTVEKTPSYFVTRDVPARIHAMSRDVKLIVVVRDPVKRAISDYTQSSSKRPGMKCFERLAFLNNDTGLIDTSWPAIKIGVYAKHLERWFKFFDRKQMHFVDGENLIVNPGDEMIKVQDFLGLRRVISSADFVFNESKGFPCLKRPNNLQSPVKCLGKTKGRRHPWVHQYTLDRLNDFFMPFNEKFFKMIGQHMDWPSSPPRQPGSL